jgi:hypothetical protein
MHNVIEAQDHDPTLWEQKSWHMTLQAAQKRARKIGASASRIIHYPENFMKLEHWVVVKPR